jgi:hypothetical protein
VVADDCEVGSELREGSVSDDVACLEAALVELGYLDQAAVDSTFDTATGDAVRQFQEARQLRPDAVVGPVTARALGIAPKPAPPDATTCVAEGRSVVVDRALQRAWFCEDGAVERQIPITSAWSQPDPGQYSVYAKDLNAASNLTGTYVRMTHFVAFTYGKFSGARIAFHSVPTYRSGEFAQPLSTVGELTQRGDSAGCIRVLPDDAQAIWDWLSIGDEVRVIT